MVFICPKCNSPMNVPPNCTQFRCPTCSAILSASSQTSNYPPQAYPYNSNPYQPAGSLNVQSSTYNLFHQVDIDGNGVLDPRELQLALSSGGLRFQLSTVYLLMNKFDANRDNFITYPEFDQLYNEVISWKQSYDFYDTDKSGSIDLNEFTNALHRNGYMFPPNVCQTIFNSADADHSNSMELDEFIQIMCEIQLVAYQFNQYARPNQNTITIDLTQLTEIVFSSRR